MYIVFCFFQNEHYNLNKVVSSGKRFIAYDIIKLLENKGLSKILLQLKEGLQNHQAEPNNLL